MRIALLKIKFHPERERGDYSGLFVDEMLQRGHQILIFAESFLADESHRCRWIKIPRSTGWARNNGFHRHVQRELEAVRRHEPVDVVYALNRTWPADVANVPLPLHAEYLRSLGGIFRRFSPRNLSISRLEKNVFRPGHLGYALVNSAYQQQNLMANYQFPVERVVILRNILNFEACYPATAAEKTGSRIAARLDRKFIIAFAASRFAPSGLDNAVNLLAALPDALRRETLLLVIGDDRREPFLAQAERCGVSDDIVWVGGSSAEELRDYLIAADLFLYPGNCGGCDDRFALQAMGCGLPLLCSSRNGVAELVQENRNGIVIDEPKDVERMARWLATFLQLPQTAREQYGAAAMETVKPFTRENHFNQLETLFRKIVESRTAGK
ncbi:glycosyltransferase family 4 protein [Victivallis sp. Marseille-Q1083]|uniref:glycosyltransferase family 4 protein n=1 Tax=Victivallis sp. Marseille-Q1083 TaxID=2717288 RepID=UPI00158A50B4|nr:glycosyltransferase family 4 protein [Victivallis sp. Marseille-Q1083]